jgi:hypothetical protein
MMGKIKEFIFVEDENGKKQYSMEKLLPMPKGFSEHPGYSTYGYDWCCTVWGTKWDVCFPIVKESGNTLILLYETAWSPNCEWVEIFCKYINWSVYKYKKEETPSIEIEHDFWELGMGFAGKLFWRPGEDFKYQHLGLVEYAYLYDKAFHDSLVENLGYNPFLPKDQAN